MLYTVTLNPTIDRTLVLDGKLIPGDVNRGNLVKVSAGGKGINCAEAACGMGAEAMAYCIVGKDNINEFENSTKELSCRIRAELKKGLTRTCLKVYGQNGLTTEFNEKGSRLLGDEMKPFIARLIGDIKEEGTPAFILLSGSIPPGVESGVYASMIALFNKLGIPTMLDCDGEALKKGIAASPYLVKPNLSELEEFLDTHFSDVADIVRTVRGLAEKYNTRILVTIGGDGMIYADKSVCYRVLVPNLACSTTVGAGDTVLGVLAVALSKGLPIDKALQLAAAAACAKVVGEPGFFPKQSDAMPYLSQISVMKWEEEENISAFAEDLAEENEEEIDFISEDVFEENADSDAEEETSEEEFS